MFRWLKLQVSFRWKNLDFLYKNPDFLLRNADFPLKNVDFITKQELALRLSMGCTILLAHPPQQGQRCTVRFGRRW